MQSQTIVRFGVFEADFRSGELRRSGVRIKIQDLPFRTLKVLLDHPGQVITREDFRNALWPEDVFVDFDRGISSAVKRLRDALDDSAENPIFIETLERRGYRWIAPISVVPMSTTQIPIIQASPVQTSDQISAVPASSVPTSDATAPQFSPSSGAGQTSHFFSPWKLVYLLPVLVLVLAFWSFRSGSRTANASLHHSPNRQAKDLYLQGRYYWSRRNPDDLHKAVDFFTQAIVHDPGYADAYVGLADCYNLLREYSAMPASEAYPRALAAAAKAVELDPGSSQAHASLAFASFWGLWDAPTADREFRRAIELDPNNAIAHHWYAMTLDEICRFSQALAEIERAQALDPTSRSILADKAFILDTMNKQKDAIELLQQMEKADPAFISPHRYLKVIYLETGDYRDYLTEQKAEATLMNDPSTLQIANAAEKGFSAGGAQRMFESLLHERQTLFEQGKSDPFALAEAYALAGDKAGALKYLKIAFDQHAQNLPSIGNDRFLDSVRNDPTFRQIQTATKLPYAQPES
jgi:DNA-binding winged helix-turn-helix (wHTH) protein/tetratricopeptide (TPR) repeat protein